MNVTPYKELPLLDVIKQRHTGFKLLRSVKEIKGKSSNDMLNMIAYRVPIPTLWFKELLECGYSAIGEHTHNVLATLWDIENDKELPRPIIRNALYSDFDMNVVRCHADCDEAIKIYTRIFKI